MGGRLPSLQWLPRGSRPPVRDRTVQGAPRPRLVGSDTSDPAPNSFGHYGALWVDVRLQPGLNPLRQHFHQSLLELTTSIKSVTAPGRIPQACWGWVRRLLTPFNYTVEELPIPYKLAPWGNLALCIGSLQSFSVQVDFKRFSLKLLNCLSIFKSFKTFPQWTWLLGTFWALKRTHAIVPHHGCPRQTMRVEQAGREKGKSKCSVCAPLPDAPMEGFSRLYMLTILVLRWQRKAVGGSQVNAWAWNMETLIASWNDIIWNMLNKIYYYIFL